jgi:hypothetical protein
MNYRLNVVDRYFHTVTQKVVHTPSGQITPILVDRTVLLLSQEMTSVALWNPVASLVFASSLLPIIPIQTSVPKDIGSQSDNLLNGGNKSDRLPMLSDFAIAVATDQYRATVEYTPSAEYRLMGMTSTTNLNRIDIFV